MDVENRDYHHLSHPEIRGSKRICTIDIYPDRNISTSRLNIVSFRRQFPDA